MIEEINKLKELNPDMADAFVSLAIRNYAKQIATGAHKSPIIAFAGIEPLAKSFHEWNVSQEEQYLKEKGLARDGSPKSDEEFPAKEEWDQVEKMTLGESDQ